MDLKVRRGGEPEDELHHDETLEVCAKCAECLNGKRSQMHRTILSQNIATRHLLNCLTTLVGNTSAIPSEWMLECPLIHICSDHIDGPVSVTYGVSS